MTRLISLIVILLTSNILSAQSNFKHGYIVTHDQDTLFGEINFSGRSQNLTRCIYRNEHGRKTLEPKDILGYGIVGGPNFSSQVLPGSFVEFLVDGELKLFRDLEKFYLQKGEDIHILESVQMEVTHNDRTLSIDSKKWRGILSYLIGDCLQTSTEITQKIAFSEKDITRIVTRYNKCQGVSYKEFKTDEKWNALQFGIAFGVTRSIINTKETPGPLTFLARNYQSTNPFVGLIFELSSPRVAKHFSLQVGLNYTKATFSSLLTETISSSFYYYDNIMEFETMRVPITVLYYLNTQEKFLSFLEFGFNYDHHFEASGMLLTEVLIEDAVVNTQSASTPYKFNEDQFGAIVGLGIGRSFGGYESRISFRYSFMPNMINVGGFTAINQRISLAINLLRK